MNSCENCQFVIFVEPTFVQITAECHRYGPHFNNGYSKWPVVKNTDWCGEYQQKMLKE